jgi:hypothetical protein
MKIKNPSQKLLEGVIKTLPILPQFVNITMTSEGVYLPSRTAKEEEIRSYLSECAEKRIIPFSRSELEYRNERWSLAPEMFWGIVNIFSTDKDYIKKAEIQGIMEGRRIHNIEVKISNPPYVEEGFKQFRDEILDVMLNNGYQINQGNLDLTVTCGTGYRQGYYSDTNIYFTPNQVRLGLGTNISDEDAVKVTEWFSQFRGDKEK